MYRGLGFLSARGKEERINISRRVCSVMDSSTLKEPAGRQEGGETEYRVLAHQGAPFSGGYGITQRLRLFNQKADP